jgi:hypothetical protein
VKQGILVIGFLLVGCSAAQIQQSKEVISLVCDINGVLVTSQLGNEKVADVIKAGKDVCAAQGGVLAAVDATQVSK